MSRILKGYEFRFRERLRQLGARKLNQGVSWLVEKARTLSLSQSIPFTEALALVYEQLPSNHAWLPETPAAPLFFCDAGLGGLARWLRAAGYDARWDGGIDDSELLREAQRLSATILTTDSPLLERRLLRDRTIPSFWLPPTFPVSRQLALVLREFDLKIREPRCMSCGGELRQANKEALKDRIPPKTYRWLDEYFVCSRCDKLMWRGTHWNQISRELQRIATGQEG